ncbi:MAG: phosphatase PAP2 family protein [Nitrospiraceae bacterium]
MDESLFLAINGLAGYSTVVDRFFLLVGNRSTLYSPAALVIGYWIWANRWEALLGSPVLAGAVGVSDFFGGQLKWLVERVRPCRSLSQAITVEPGGCGGLFSFPSNHAVNTAAVAAFLQVLYPRSGWVSWPIVAVIGFARVYVGAHYVTDVLGGWLIGVLLGAGAGWLLLQWPRFRRRAVPTPQVNTTESPLSN